MVNSIPAGYGENQPRLRDDRVPMILVILDGLGDRGAPELAGQTPAEAARTPCLDTLVARGSAGVHIPFGWGRATSSERSHWAMFGYDDVAFPGRAVLEALGCGVDLPDGTGVLYGALRTSHEADGVVWIDGRATSSDAEQCVLLLAGLQEMAQDWGYRIEAVPGRPGELLLLSEPRFTLVSDSDPFFESFHPWLEVVSLDECAGSADAQHVNRFLRACRHELIKSSVNVERRTNGLPQIDVLTSKWGGVLSSVASFESRVGVAAALVASSSLYRGLGRLLAMSVVAAEVGSGAGPGDALSRRIRQATDLTDQGVGFVHVHTKATDEAGHTKSPIHKRDVIEELDGALAPLLDLADSHVIAVTGDHATPSTGGVLHTGDPTPFVLAGPSVPSDAVTRFGESVMRQGFLGVLHAIDVLPLMLSHANRPAFLGHQIGSYRLGLPDGPRPMPPA